MRCFLKYIFDQNCKDFKEILTVIHVDFLIKGYFCGKIVDVKLG